MRGLARPLVLLLASACSRTSPPPPPSIVEVAPSTSAAPRAAATAPSTPRLRLDGHAFPDHVLALTWDDGPDDHTLELARWLSAKKVRATFFVVGDWRLGLSEEPGRGAHVERTGYGALPILGDLVALGHRLGNHTAHHVLLAGAAADTVRRELTENQRALDPFVKNDLRLFRAPGGAFDDAAARAIDGLDIEGPVHWDIDGKDWEGSLYCGGEPDQCEPLPADAVLASPGEPSRPKTHDGSSSTAAASSAAPGAASGAAPARTTLPTARPPTRLKPSVVAARYLAAIEREGHGIVLLHDRVGHVGSRYALDVATDLVPRLVARGYVFAAPVLRFGKPSPRPDARVTFTESHRSPNARLEGDLNGDGVVDVCTRAGAIVSCALARASGPLTASVWAENIPAGAIALVDVNGDGRADLCFEDGRCALAP